MKVIGLTGGIAAGKSLIAKRLQELGFQVFDADKSVRSFYQDISQLDKVEEVVGMREINEIRQLVFEDQLLLKRLQDIIHPYVQEEIMEFVTKNNNENLIFLEVPLLFEGELWKLCDHIIYVSAEDHVRKKRFLSRGKGGEDIFEQVKVNQVKEVDIMHHDPFVIKNSSAIKDAYLQLEEILMKL